MSVLECTIQNSKDCIAKSHPEIFNLLEVKEEGYKFTYGSKQKTSFICPNCKHSDVKIIKNVVKQGFSCAKCSDGVSYPEKFMFNFLTQLEVFFKKEEVFSWSENVLNLGSPELSGKKRYDFYIPSLNCIIETNGEQHYTRGFKTARKKTVEMEQENDTLKCNLAIRNGIHKYIVVDCRKSELEYIRKSIEESELAIVFDISNIDWSKCHQYACGTLIKEVCSYWNDGMKAIAISNEVKLHKSTIINYLKQGAAIGWCDYDPNQEMKNGGTITGKETKEKTQKKVIQLSLDYEFIKQWDGITEAENKLNINNITSNCKGRRQSAGGYKWMYKEDYRKYIGEKCLYSTHVS